MLMPVIVSDQERGQMRRDGTQLAANDPPMGSQASMVGAAGGRKGRAGAKTDDTNDHDRSAIRSKYDIGKLE
jgi:hypothetical protein